MNKNVLIGIAAFGGLVLITALLPDTPTTEVENTPTEEVNPPTLQNEVTVNFPTYPNATVSHSRESTGDDGRVFYSISLTTGASITDINDWYREALSQNGWSIKSDKNVAGYQIIQAEKNNLFTSMQAANGAGGTAVISQQAQIRPKL
ncbi:hypothetical protein H6784_05720 [Candidatus Nomurabacteria bacterium]|nr:hypothetical protein [Candidatus Kaiserbacteria bacterium]MCB9814875.1 hypothetical protein [Candidatus Nomurabacteria bacterium]